MSSRLDHGAKERVREANDIVDVVEQCVSLRRAGSNYKACCPFHEEKTPSFVVTPSKQIWHCFGCGAGGDVFAFVMQFHGMSFPEALRYLADRSGIALPEYRAQPGEVGRDDIYTVNARYAEWFHDMLLRQEAGHAAREYLQQRGIHAELAKAFGLGFAPDSWTGACQSAALRSLPQAHVRAAGLAKARQDGSLYDLFRNRVIFPIHGAGGDIVAFGGRTIGDDDAKYINSPETPVYRKGSQLYNLHRARRAIQQAGYAILVEGYIDAIRLSAAGFEQTVATCGTALTAQQAKVLGRHADQVVVVYDGDAAGRTAAEKAAGLLLETDLDVRLAVLPEGQDPDDYLQAQGAEAFRALVAEALDFVDFVLRDAGDVRHAEIETRVTFADRLRGLAQRIPHDVRRRLYLERIAMRLDLDERDLRGSVAARPEAVAEAAPPPVAPTPLRESEREPLRLVLHNLDRLDEWDALLEAADAFPPLVRKILRRAVEARPAYASVQALLDATEDEAERRVLRELEIVDGARRQYPPAWLLHHVNLQRAKRRISELSAQVRDAERGGEVDAQRFAGYAAEITEMMQLKDQSTEALQALEVEYVAA